MGVNCPTHVHTVIQSNGAAGFRMHDAGRVILQAYKLKPIDITMEKHSRARTNGAMLMGPRWGSQDRHQAELRSGHIAQGVRMTHLHAWPVYVSADRAPDCHACT